MWMRICHHRAPIDIGLNNKWSKGLKVCCPEKLYLLSNSYWRFMRAPNGPVWSKLCTDTTQTHNACSSALYTNTHKHTYTMPVSLLYTHTHTHLCSLCMCHVYFLTPTQCTHKNPQESVTFLCRLCSCVCVPVSRGAKEGWKVPVPGYWLSLSFVTSKNNFTSRYAIFCRKVPLANDWIWVCVHDVHGNTCDWGFQTLSNTLVWPWSHSTVE